MEIERIDTYDDDRFDKEVLKQHGAFLVDGQYPCSFRIVDEKTAVAGYHNYEGIEELIEEFRFYAEHITCFLDEQGNLLKEYPRVKTFDLELDQIQPSQFFVDEDKLKEVASFVRGPEDVVIPVTRMENTNQYISQDGHTRMYCACQKGIRTVKAFLAEEENDYISYFFEEARNRGIYKISDMQVLSHEEYTEKWHRFCDKYFSSREQD